MPDARATCTATPLGRQVRMLLNRVVVEAYALIVLMMIATFSF